MEGEAGLREALTGLAKKQAGDAASEKVVRMYSHQLTERPHDGLRFRSRIRMILTYGLDPFLGGRPQEPRSRPNEPVDSGWRVCVGRSDSYDEPVSG